ncbi:hypothetical protein HNQ60_002199 [Povalibacter uvarum]|uniref:Uncharacterized protein n=1 Tax=Povalibacter uvarum TaxID=732238 RepID=A0A841HJC5_9GAMM|nr:hypothetical protein [Povalibacter uvarum]MBB6093321.1 hypothetical protein [Povalibacter uvarum]
MSETPCGSVRDPRSLVRWLVSIVAVLGVAALAASAWVYLASEAHLRSFERPSAFAFRFLPTPSPSRVVRISPGLAVAAAVTAKICRAKCDGVAALP